MGEPLAVRVGHALVLARPGGRGVPVAAHDVVLVQLAGPHLLNVFRSHSTHMFLTSKSSQPAGPGAVVVVGGGGGGAVVLGWGPGGQGQVDSEGEVGPLVQPVQLRRNILPAHIHIIHAFKCHVLVISQYYISASPHWLRR